MPIQNLVPRPTSHTLPQALGLQAWSHDPSIVGAATAPTAGTRYSVGIGLAAGQVITNVLFNVAVAGAGTVPTNIFCGLHNTSAMLAVSADVAASSAWTAVGFGVVPLTAPYTVTTTGLYYVEFLQVGAWGTTAMTMNRSGGFSNIFPGSVYGAATFGTSQTALPAVAASPGTISTSGALRYWVGVS